MIKKLLSFFKLLQEAAEEFFSDNGVKLSASLSYYTVFSIGPVLIIIISLAGIFFGREAVEGKIFWQINGLVGADAAAQVQEIIKNIQKSQFSASGAVIGVVLLIIGATGVFTEIQDSINYIWSVKAKPKRGWVHLLLNRLISFSLIISFGFILLVSLIVHALFDLLQERLMSYFDEGTVYVFQAVNYVILYAVIAVLFAVIFKVLPDAKIKWRDALVGAAFTSVLFLVGKFLISFYLAHSSVGVTYGAATSIVIILLWVYYTSIILYFGAEFTKVYTIAHGGGIEPDKAAVFIVKHQTRELSKRSM
jgi:membrane protein